MASGGSQSWQQRLRKWGIPLIVVAVALVIIIAVWPAPDRSESHTVELGGPAGAESYEIADTGAVTSSTGSYNGDHYEETSLDVPIHRLTTGGGNMTPDLTATFETADGGTVSCEMPRTHVWSTASGSTETLQCDRFVPFDDLGGVRNVHVFG